MERLTRTPEDFRHLNAELSTAIKTAIFGFFSKIPCTTVNISDRTQHHLDMLTQELILEDASQVSLELVA